MNRREILKTLAAAIVAKKAKLSPSQPRESHHEEENTAASLSHTPSLSFSYSHEPDDEDLS